MSKIFIKKKKEPSTRVYFAALEVPTSLDIHFYVSVIPVSTLAKVCSVSRADEDPKKGYQRLLSKNRLKQIADYLDSGKAIPGALILSAQASAALQFERSSGKISFVKAQGSFL